MVLGVEVSGLPDSALDDGDIIPIVDAEKVGAARRTKTTVGALKTAILVAIAETIDDRVAALLTEGANVTLTYDDTAGTLAIASTGGGGGAATGFVGVSAICSTASSGDKFVYTVPAGKLFTPLILSFRASGGPALMVSGFLQGPSAAITAALSMLTILDTTIAAPPTTIANYLVMPAGDQVSLHVTTPGFGSVSVRLLGVLEDA